jgi:hypothetical protein
MARIGEFPSAGGNRRRVCITNSVAFVPAYCCAKITDAFVTVLSTSIISKCDGSVA